MYHFTDVPMIISGDYILILDPQQSFLPRNKRQKRKVGVKIKLSTARRDCVDHLMPFHGLCGFSSDEDHYEGTLFRFPFRGNNVTRLKEHDSFIDSEKAKNLLDKYFEDASMALLFLRNISSIDLIIRGENHSRWCVSASRADLSGYEIFRQVKIRSQKEKEKAAEKIWRIGVTDIVDCPSNVVKPGRGAAKITECGIAACISDPKTSQRIFCTLPTPFRTCIPVSFHASFAVTGDRKSIPFEDVRRDPVVAEWNKWLLADCIPGFYLDFLKDLAPIMGGDSFEYWPLINDRDHATKLTNTVVEAFWEKLSDNDMVPLFPLANSMHAPDNASPLKIRSSGKVRKLYATTSLRTAQFDGLPSSTSTQLRQLFLKICPSLVVLPAELGFAIPHKKIGKSMSYLGSELLSTLFREEDNCKYLAQFYAQERNSKAMALLMSILMEKAGSDPDSLNYLSGCRILPKLDGSLGLLTTGREAGFEWNLIASNAEQTLFSFAASCFVNTELFHCASPVPSIELSIRSTFRTPIMDLLNSKLNVRPLKLQDVGTLLSRGDSPIHQVDLKDRDSWIRNLWKYLNIKFRKEFRKEMSDGSIPDLLAQNGLRHVPIYRIVGNEQEQYCTPREFNTTACIVDPLKEDHRTLYMAIKDLRLADRDYLLFWLLAEETTEAFDRLIRAFQIIETRCKMSITVYLDQLLTPQNRKVRSPRFNMV